MNSISSQLLLILPNVNEWLKFAETKNAVLLGFSGAGVTAATSVLSTMQGVPNSVRTGLLVSIALLGICACLCTISFLPKTNLEKILWSQSAAFKSMKPSPSNDNFYYFGHLQKYSPDELLSALNHHYFNDSVSLPFPRESRDLAAQVVVNSEIAFRKYQLFTYGVYLLTVAIIIVPICMLFSLLTLRSL
jgi:hypothetical protein